MTESRTPKFCLVCGSRLIAENSISGFDPYTGDPVEDQGLRCNNPTVETSKLGGRKVTPHPSWAKFEGEWSHN